jgi:hypothetical protein
MWDYSHKHPEAEHDPPRFPYGARFMPKLFNWLPWGMKTHAMNGMKMLNQIKISALSLIRLMENCTIMLGYEDKGTKKDHVVQINIPVEDLLKSDLLTYTCNMMDSFM